MTPARAGQLIIEAARAAGFHRVGLAPATASQALGTYQAWLAESYHGDMAFLASPEHVEGRRAPATLLPEVRTVIAVAMAYDDGRTLIPAAALAVRGRIARYAAGEDYHIVVRDKLFALARQLATALGQPVLARPCVDSAPVLERDVARAAGLGFIGKNTMLITRGLGSYVVLGELLVDIEATAPEAAPQTGCGSCTACLSACPTGAFPSPYVLDARRCLSYLTIEHRDDIPHAYRAAMGLWIFGCDLCQEACPYNQGKRPLDAPALPPRDLEHLVPDLIRLVTFGSNQLRQFVKRTAMRRAPREQILRNIAVALGNSGAAPAAPALIQLAGHRHPMVRRHAAWGLARLGELCPATWPGCQAALRTLCEDTDPSVSAEARRYLRPNDST